MANWEQGAVKHPGRMTRLAHEHGRSVHAELEADKKKPGSLGQAARLGLRFEAQASARRRKK